MPLVDWIRTDLNNVLNNGAIALKYDHLKMCAFEIYILKLKNAENRYTSYEIGTAKKILNKMTNSQKNFLKKSLLGGLAANDRQYSIKDLNYEIENYKNISHKDLRENLNFFLSQIFTTLKECNIKYCIHPDDPPYKIYGLPRIISNESDIKYITSIFNHENVGITLCTGSLGVNKKNNLKRIIKKYGRYINFVHLRNIIREKNSKNFYESSHLEGDLNMVEIIKNLLNEEKKRKKKKKIISIFLCDLITVILFYMIKIKK